MSPLASGSSARSFASLLRSVSTMRAPVAARTSARRRAGVVTSIGTYAQSAFSTERIALIALMLFGMKIGTKEPRPSPRAAR